MDLENLVDNLLKFKKKFMSKLTIINNLVVSIKNAYLRNHKIAYCKYSKLNLQIIMLLYREGIIIDFKKKDSILILKLKYYRDRPLINNIVTIYKPSLKIYSNCDDLKKYYSQYDIFFISTSKGLMSSNSLSKIILSGYKIGGQALFGIQLYNKS